MILVLCLSGRPRVKENLEYLVNTIPQNLRSEAMEVVCVVNWACEPDSSDKAFLDKLKTNGVISHWTWTPTFFGVGEVMFDALYTGFHSTGEHFDFALYLPTDSSLDPRLSNSVLGNLPKLVEPIKAPSPPSLILGDYSPKLEDGTDNLIKQGIEEHVKSVIKHLFPDEWKNVSRVRRPRSEFFAIQREFFFYLTTEKALWSVFDPTVIALIEAERNPKKWFWQSVDLGNFYEEQSRDLHAIVRQVHRTTYLLTSYWVRDNLNLGLQWSAQVLGAFAIEMESLSRLQELSSQQDKIRT